MKIGNPLYPLSLVGSFRRKDRSLASSARRPHLRLRPYNPLSRLLAKCSFLCFLAAISLWGAVASAAAPAQTNQARVILVAGAPGETEFGSNFVRQVELWSNACQLGRLQSSVIGLREQTDVSDYDRLKAAIELQLPDATQPLWLVFIGHGTFDGSAARFNLRGPDVTASELRDWLRPFRRPIVFINTSSASAPFLNQLSATNRVILTATRSGTEQNFARFGVCFAESLTGAESDLDQDGQTSVLEAFLAASARVAEFYKTQGRLATEHALIDDNGDGLGTPADWFRGVRPVKKPQGSAALDGVRAHQVHLVLSQAELKLPDDVRAKRDALELSIARLRESKSQQPEPEYYRELEKLLLQLQEAYGPHLD